MIEQSVTQYKEAASARLPHAPNLNQRILVVEDDPSIRQMNFEALIHSGYQVATAEDGVTGWEALYASNYDLLITGNNRPKVVAVDLLKKIHATRLALPVVMATAILPAWELAQYPWLKPAAVLLKPYTFDELLATVKNVLHATAAVCAKVAPLPSSQSQMTPQIRYAPSGGYESNAPMMRSNVRW